MHLLNSLQVLRLGESYWKVIFTDNKQLCELDEKPVDLVSQEMLTGDGRIMLARSLFAPRVRMRHVEWLEDLIGSGDLGRVKEAILCTPKGEAHFTITEPYTVFQFSRGTMAVDATQGRTIRIKNCQVVGVVTDKETGLCEYAAWDVQKQDLYTGHNNVLDFRPWHTDMAAIGALDLQAMDVRGVNREIA